LSIILNGNGPSVGDRSNTVATMKMFADEFTANKAASGWQKLPSGLIVQWGSVGTLAGGSVTVTFPVVFPTALLGLTLGTDTSGPYFLNYRFPSLSGFLGQGWQSSTGAAQSGVAGTYFAIGY
jgi:hypothetical protein